jgi:hypothetical protein
MEPQMIGYNPVTRGCTFKDCGTQETATLDGYTGRRCSEHPPEPPWISLADLGRFRDAFQALLRHLTARAGGWL